jgi:D-serine deaminase-like pyridoxal phosphate-dependent protein|tara:strand:+ start:2360 stop:3451 length:1092 start_codon:yes stop_codon:yes gene_type:complete
MFTNYKIKNIESIETPEHLIFEEKVINNIKSIISLVGDQKRIVPHAKTHKSKDTLKILIDHGITRHKTSTLNELEILAECNPEELILAYPIASKLKANRLKNIVKKFPDTKFSTIVSNKFHFDLVKNIGNLNGVYIDLDTGMNRTGILEKNVEELLEYITFENKQNINGIHAYDGQTYGVISIEDRVINTKKSLSSIRNVEKLMKEKFSINPEIIVGGSWSFHFYIDEKDIKLSPGTWIYWDASNIKQTELNFEIAGLVLGQVIDENLANETVTIDIGAKAISSDPLTENRLELIDKPNAKLVHQNEEHGIIKLNGEKLNLGDYVLAKPGHACTLTPKYNRALKIDKNGDISGVITPHARDRV